MNYVINKKLGFLLIIFPIWVPILYFGLLNIFPDYDKIIFLLYMIILGETHFGTTWWMYFDKRNQNWLLNNKLYSIYYPLIILIFLFFMAYLISLELALFVILLFNFFHVTRQSIGISKIYFDKSISQNNKNLIINLTYVYSTAIILVGIFRFVLKNEYFTNQILNTNLIFWSLFFVTILFIYFFKKITDLKTIFSFSTGILIWYPLLFTTEIYHAFAMGVGMHYMQYLAITYPIYFRKNKNENISNNINFLIKFTSYLILYSVIMVFLSNSDIGKKYSLYLVPIFFQTLHFYADMFTWRFSIEHVRNNVAKFMFSRT